MPPSPALRFSPSRELNHKRGRSLEGGLHLKVKDDDLTLFTDMENRERETFLLDSSDNIDESFSTKLKYFSDFKLGITIPVRGESSLLNEEGDKNDYDWLLTPPDTPLFPSLDDEDEKQPVNIVHRGRPRSQPIQISRTSMTENSYRSGRSSASPHRLSPSPRSSNNSFLSRGRPSSAPRTSPGPVLRAHSPSQRSSTPNKPSTMTPTSSTPTLRRMSTGSNATPSSAKSGTSPGKATRGDSASPKLRAWQSNLPGFSSDAPPNLRTSSDWPTSRVRGVSLSSRNGRDTSYSKIRRQSMSPTASRSASSSHSHDRDRFSSHSKGSIASSGDDDMDSLQSAPVVLSQQSTARKNGSFPSTRNNNLSKKPSRTLSVGSAPKRSFDYALRQMENRKGPQNMFRPLLSSVPSTTFYAGKANLTHYPIISRNSSITTSSNASSEQGVSVAIDTEGSEHDQDDLNSDWVKTPYSDTQEEEIFVLDRADEEKESVINEDGKPADQHGDFGESTSSQAEARVCKAISSDQPAVVDAETCSHFGYDSSEVVSGSIIARCSICYSEFQTADHINDDASYICPNCSAKSGLIGEAPPFSVEINHDDVTRGMNLEENNPVEMDGDSILGELPGEPGILATSIKNEASITQDIVVHSMDNLKEGGLCLLDPERVGSHEFNPDEKNCAELNQQLHYFDGLSSSKADNAESLGISVLLKRSNSTKWPVVQGRTFTATTISCDNLSYMRDNINSIRNYSVEGSASASSSVDLSSHTQRQLGDMEIRREDINRMLLSSRSSVSGFSDNSYGAIVYSEGISEGRIEDFAKNLEIEGVEDSGFVPKESQVLEGKEFDHQRVVVSSASDLATPARESQLNDFLVPGFVSNENFDAGNALGISDDRENILEIADSYVCMEKSKNEEADTTNNGAHCLVDMGDSLRDNVVMISGEFKEESGEDRLPSNPDGATSQHPENMVWVSDEPPASTTIEKGGSVTASETDIIDQAHNCSEEAIVKIEGVRGHKARSLTLEEATDTILFCSSIVHNLAYEAAAIALEKERPTIPVDVYRATPASFVGRSSMKDSARRSKAAKTRHKWADSAVKPPVQKIESDVENRETFVKDVSVSFKPDNMKPPKLESKCNCTIM